MLDETYRLLEQAMTSGMTYDEIADASGVNVHWLRKFKLRKWENPGISRVEKLHQHLKPVTQVTQ